MRIAKTQDKAKKAAAKKKKAAAKKAGNGAVPQPRQGSIKGANPPHVQALDDLALVYRERTVDRCALSKEEAEAHAALLAKMTELKIDTYRWTNPMGKTFILRRKQAAEKVAFDEVKGEK